MATLQDGYIGVKPGWTRVSFPYYMMEEEFDFILQALEFMAMYGQRFVPLYNYNWKTAEWSVNTTKLVETLLVAKQKNHNFSHLMKVVSVIKVQSVKVQKQKDRLICSQFESYMETARHIASLVPKFPPERKIPEGFDPSLLMFRV